MRSVRARITITAALATLIALVIVGAIFLRSLDSSLRAEVDDIVADQANDFSLNVTTFDSLDATVNLNDFETVLVVLDAAGEAIFTNDSFEIGPEIAAQINLNTVSEFDVSLHDVTLTQTEQTDGAERMRAAAIGMVFEDAELDEADLYVVVARSTIRVDEQVTRARNVLLIIVPALVLFVAALAWWLTGRALRPVEVMRREVDAISAGDLSQRVSEPGSRDEIDRLASTMNELLGRLDRSLTQQQRFVNDAAHELRTPLASVAAQLDVDRAHPEVADPAATSITVRAQVDRMQQIISSLLALARADQGGSDQPAGSLVDLDVVIGEAATRAASASEIRIAQKGVVPIEVRGDETALSRTFDNLFSNAIRHASSTVEVATGADDAGVWAVVDDDGSGIPVGQREAVFDRFVRLDEARTRDAGGSGLGLALSRETAERHGGSLFVMDSPLGGARFVLRLPAAAPKPDAP